MKKKEKNNNALIIAFIFIATVMILFMIFLLTRDAFNSNNSAPPDIETILTSEGLAIDEMKIDSRATNDTKFSSGTLSGRQIYYAGLEDCVVNENTVVYLENLAENIDIYMTYEVSVDENIIFKTELIPPGEYVEWMPAENLEAGQTYVVYLKETPYYEESEGKYLPLTSPTNMVNITVAK